MDLEEVKDSVKEFIDTRIKSPYFTSVLIIWCYVNRTLLFGIFNFTNEQTFEEKLSWARNQLNTIHTTPILNIKYHGLFETILYSIIVAFVAMTFYNYLHTLAKIIYHYVSKSSKWVLQKIRPSSYVDKNEYDRLVRRSTKMDKELSEKDRLTLSLRETNELLNVDIDNKQTELTKLKSKDEKLKILETQLEIENNKFIILFAQYGKYHRFIEVTKILNDVFISRPEVEINNELFKIDPYPFKIKELNLTYKIQGKEYRIDVQENEILKLSDKGLIIVQTDNSKQKQMLLSNQSQFCAEFRGSWQYTKFINNVPNQREEIKIDDNGNYWVGDKLKYNIQVTEFTLPKKIRVKKINTTGEVEQEEILEKINASYFRAINQSNDIIEYKKIDSN